MPSNAFFIDMFQLDGGDLIPLPDLNDTAWKGIAKNDPKGTEFSFSQCCSRIVTGTYSWLLPDLDLTVYPRPKSSSYLIVHNQLDICLLQRISDQFKNVVYLIGSHHTMSGAMQHMENFVAQNLKDISIIHDIKNPQVRFVMFNADRKERLNSRKVSL